MKITTNDQHDQHKLRTRTANAIPNLSGIRMVFFALICLSSAAVVLFKAGRYIHHKYSWQKYDLSEMHEYFKCDYFF